MLKFDPYSFITVRRSRMIWDKAGSDVKSRISSLGRVIM